MVIGMKYGCCLAQEHVLLESVLLKAALFLVCLLYIL